MRTRRMRLALGLFTLVCFGTLYQGACIAFGADQALRSIDFCFLFDCQNGALGGLVQPCPFVTDPTQPDENGIGNANTFVDCPTA